MADSTNAPKSRTALYVVVVVVTFLLMAFLVQQMIKYTQPAPVGADRAAARARDNADIDAAGADQLNSFGYVEQAKGVVRMPVDQAMKLTIQGYKEGGAFRSNLIARVEKATEAPPKPPEAPNEYE